MKIKSLTLDGNDMAKAAQMFLATQGITMPIHSIRKPYSYGDEYEITFQFEVDEPAPAPMPELAPDTRPMPPTEDPL